MAIKSNTIIEALDNIRYSLDHVIRGGIEYPNLAIGAVEHVLSFKINEHHHLRDIDKPRPFFSNRGNFSDLQDNELKGSSCQTSLQVDASKVGSLVTWPAPQPAPFDEPPSIPANTEPLGFSKQAYFFSDGSSLVTTGPSVPKLLLLKGGGAQLWVASAGVITQGTGIYEGVRGMSSYVGSANFAAWPANPPDQFKLLASGFPAVIAVYFKLVLKADQA